MLHDLKIDYLSVDNYSSTDEWIRSMKGLWIEKDYEFLCNQKAIAKIFRSFEKIDHNFNISIFVGLPSTGKHKAAQSIILPNCINFSLVTNITNNSNWMPTNAWIIIHRLSHAIVENSYDGKIWTEHFPSSQGPEAALWFGLMDLWNLIGPLDQKDRDAISHVRSQAEKTKSFQIIHMDSNHSFPSFTNWMEAFLYNILTMKSARDGNLSNELDVFAEAFAQHFVTGKFRMNRFKDIEIIRFNNEYEWAASRGITLQTSKVSKTNQIHWKAVDHGAFDAKVDEIEEDVNNRMERLAFHLIGKHLVF